MRPAWMAAGGNSTVGLEVILSILLGFFGGRWLDAHFGTAPYLAVVGFVFGVATAIRFLVRAARRMSRATERDGFNPNHTGRDAKFALEQQKRT